MQKNSAIHIDRDQATGTVIIRNKYPARPCRDLELVISIYRAHSSNTPPPSRNDPREAPREAPRESRGPMIFSVPASKHTRFTRLCVEFSALLQSRRFVQFLHSFFSRKEVIFKLRATTNDKYFSHFATIIASTQLRNGYKHLGHYVIGEKRQKLYFSPPHEKRLKAKG